MPLSLLPDEKVSIQSLAGILEALPDGALVRDSQGAIIFCNSAMERLLGVEASQLIKTGEAEWEVVEVPESNAKPSDTSQDRLIIRPDGSQCLVNVRELELPAKNGFNRLFLYRDVTRRRRLERSFRTIVERTAGVTGDEFFEQLLTALIALFDASHGIIGVLEKDKEGNQRIRTIALQNREGNMAPLVYDISDTPCADALKGECFYPENVGELFPKDDFLTDNGIQSYVGTALLNARQKRIGILSLMHTQPTTDSGKEMLPILHMMAARCAAEVERDRALNDLEESRRRYALAARGANDGLWEWNYQTGECYYSERWRRILGIPVGEKNPTRKTWLEAIVPEDKNQFEAALQAHLKGKRNKLAVELRVMHGDGSLRWISVRALAEFHPNGKPMRLAGSVRDITERKRAEEQLLQSALTDNLTGLANRSLFFDHVRRALARLEKNREDTFAILFMDIDRFKRVNDEFGHLIGDELLVEIAERMKASLPPQAVPARFGADEFAVFLPTPADVEDNERPEEIAQQMLVALNHPIKVRGHMMPVGFSIGIVECDDPENEPESLLRDADAAMNQARAQGKGRAVLFHFSMRDESQSSMMLEAALVQAVENKELKLFYQPIFDIKSRTAVGFEALMRWVHPKLGNVPPSRFIPIAEEIGIISDIGDWGLHEVCRQLKKWQKISKRCPYIGVNISMRQMIDPNFVQGIFDTIEEYELDPELIKLELTETILLHRSNLQLEGLHRLRDAGISLCIDDFGVEYSSLNYLQHLPVDTLKIDRSFVAGMTRGDTRVDQLVRTIIAMAHTMNMEVVAEGIETEQQFAELKAHKCEFGQGYLFSYPIPASEANVFLRDDD